MPHFDPSDTAIRSLDRLKAGAVVLAGGHGRRLGHDKASLRLGDQTAIARVCETALNTVQTVVVAGRAGQALPHLPSNVVVAYDPIPDCGPLAGMLAGFRALSERFLKTTLVLACDHPLVTTQVLQQLIRHLDTARAVAVRHAGRRYPLLAAYRIDTCHVLEDALAQRNLRATAFLDRCAPAYLEGDALRAADPDRQSLINVNELAQLEEARQALRRKEPRP